MYRDKSDVALPVRNELPKGLNAIKYFFDNVWNISKSGFRYVSFCRLFTYALLTTGNFY